MPRTSTIGVLAVLLLAIALPGCKSAEGETPDEKRQYVQDMAGKALSELYARKPETRAMVAGAAGYAVFSNVGMKIILLASGNGYGVVHDNANGRDTYMSMRELGVGVGLGVDDFRAVFVFHNQAVLDKFVSEGWEWGGDASATAKSDETGGALGADANLSQGISVYRFTKSGISLMAAVTGTKYWKDDELN